MSKKRNHIQAASSAGPDEQASSGRREQVKEGIGVAPGIAIGPIYVYARDAFDVEQRRLDDSDVEAEAKRFEEAVVRSERDLKKIASIAREKLGEGSATIFEAQALMLRDEALYQAALECIRRDKVNADYAVQTVMDQHRRLMQTSDSEYLRERDHDLLDVQERIIRHLRRGKILSSIDQGTIVVAESLTAADIVLFSRRNILGCATDYGGATSHVSIMARALGVPAVVSMHGLTEQVESGQMAILDGLHGRVIVNPEPETLAFYEAQQVRYRRFLEEQKHLVPLPPETLDGHRVSLKANLEFKEELKLLGEYGAEGIGLFRTEILFLMQGRISYSEDEQFEIYKQIVEAVSPNPTTFRVLDLGGDKMLPMAHREQNPFLGWRGLRILLDKPDVLLPQLRAMLRASALGPARILVPMVTNLEELYRFREMLSAAQHDLEQRGAAFDPHVPVGIMVEVPAVALMAERFAREVDFFSIGTNDLTQYVLAVDRGNDLVSDKYNELHPAVLALIKQTVDAGHQHGIPVGICGELASNPKATVLLVGLGLDEFSASPAYLPEVKRVIRALKHSDAQCLAQQALAAGDAAEVEEMLERWLHSNACDLANLIDLDYGEPGSPAAPQQVDYAGEEEH